METRNADRIYLLGHDEYQIIGSKLPSNGQVLRVLFYNVQKVKLDLRPSAAIAIKEVEVFWDKARIPVRETHHSIDKLLELHKNWRKLQKTRKRRCEMQEIKERKFLNAMDDLFDIAYNNALNTLKIQEDKDFLLNQRKKGRPGLMIGADQNLVQKEKRQAVRLQQKEVQRERFEAMVELQGMTYF